MDGSTTVNFHLTDYFFTATGRFKSPGNWDKAEWVYRMSLGLVRRKSEGGRASVLLC
jgi:hypothetical protein